MTTDASHRGPTRRGPPLEARTAHLLSEAGRIQSGRFAAALQPHGLRAKQFVLLNLVDLADGPSQHELGRRLGLDPSGLVATIDQLEARELLERHAHPTDRRRYALHLTPAGEQALRAARSVVQEGAIQLFANLSADELGILHDLLGRIVAGTGPQTSLSASSPSVGP